ncbi:energy-coupling factor transporter ATPase [Lacicoccus alkaliphilus]|uniref:Energy-coupling factor transport system ATP-binding protein n=1 Tax=Lacicoccus alkaliphilus DSM 16010 TaxID=1123231 RepID=A0A1M7EEZ1_9BACL|nr:energy-coupling factor transporter ATPase [Salinicoccus alkaliphilus]SHL90208.1 energy-coupling factor transport system ATP-binding protein [Salinicoccus alkaliphilus DSM 16010]
MIKIDNLTYRYQADAPKALDDISLSFKTGDWVSIIGHNGSGKSTLVKLMMGILEGYSGEISVDGEVLTPDNLQRFRERFAIVFQNPDNQFVGATVEDDVAFGLENQGLPREVMLERTEAALEAVNMLAYRRHAPARLSGGQKQRVAIAGALAMEPAVLILDEATSMLDPEGRSDMLAILNDIHKTRTTTLIYITHDLGEIEDSDYAVIMKDGKVISEGTIEHIFSDTDTLIESRLVLPYQMQISRALLDGGYVTHDELVARL